MLVDLEPPFLVIKPGVSEDEYYRLDEDSPWELVDGRLVMSPSSRRHEELFRFLLVLVNGFLETKGGGVVLGSRYPMRLDERWSPEPDLIVVRDRKSHLLTRRRLEGPADLVVEIASEGDPRFDAREKLPRYRQAGIEEIWLVDPFQRILHAHTRSAATGAYESSALTAGRLASQVLPGFWLEVAWLWQEPLPSSVACLDLIVPRQD
ncbi:MAG TPA: Uma2 family endonuclease [Thermoanaerobaculia bacterium]|nr:Uma2 family endonuclease [Thermoanaerobaculia bacterium]